MFDVSSSFLDTLPSVAFHKYRELPACPGIYFALLPNGDAVYIGSTINLQKRWTSHHVFQELEKDGCATIAYYLCKEEALNQLEQIMIQELNPSLNGPWYPRPIRLLEQAVLQTLKVTEAALRMLRIIAAHTGERQYVVIERVLAEELRKVNKHLKGDTHE
jgi:hypothetical protein